MYGLQFIPIHNVLVGSRVLKLASIYSVVPFSQMAKSDWVWKLITDSPVGIFERIRLFVAANES